VQEPGGADVDGAVVRLDRPAGGQAAVRLSTLTGRSGALVGARDDGNGRVYAGRGADRGRDRSASAAARPRRPVVDLRRRRHAAARRG
jgi:hypothetical protein